MCIISGTLPGKSLWRNVCRNPYIIQISAKDPERADAGGLVGDRLVASFATPEITQLFRDTFIREPVFDEK